MDIQSWLASQNGSTTSGTGGTSGATTTAARKSDLSALNQEDFMKLMLEQLKSQDPFKPTDNTQFIAQMAQLSTVTGISEMKNSLTDMVDTLRGTQMLSASSLVGRNVLVEASSVDINASSPDLVGQVELTSAADSVDIEIRNSAGAVVKRLHADQQNAGTLTFGWDGTDENGSQVAAGKYSIVATASSNGQSEALTTSVRAPVTGASLPTDGSGARLQVQGLGTLKLSDIKEVG